MRQVKAETKQALTVAAEDVAAAKKDLAEARDHVKKSAGAGRLQQEKLDKIQIKVKGLRKKESKAVADRTTYSLAANEAQSNFQVLTKEFASARTLHKEAMERRQREEVELTKWQDRLKLTHIGGQITNNDNTRNAIKMRVKEVKSTVETAQKNEKKAKQREDSIAKKMLFAKKNLAANRKLSKKRMVLRKLQERSG